MNRTELRKWLLAERSKMSVELLQKIGNQIAEKVTSSEWYKNAHIVHCFSGSIAKGEVSTSTLLNQILESGRQLVMPRMTEILGILSHHRVTDLSTLAIGKWGIPEPPGGLPVAPEKLDLVLVPGLAADLKGNRLGFGMGYYDRFLASTPAKTMILLPQRMILDYIPGQPHDIPIQAIATEFKIVECDGTRQQE